MRDRSRGARPLGVRLLIGAALTVLLAFAAAGASEPHPPVHLIGGASLAKAGEPAEFDPIDLFFLCVPGYFLLQAALTFWTTGGWRKASLVPAVVMGPILAYTVLAFAAQSNLWPLLMLLSAPLAFLYLVALSVVLLLRRIAKAT